MVSQAKDDIDELWLGRGMFALEPRVKYLLVGSVYALVFAYHTRRSVPVYRSNWQQERILALMLHILSGVAELAKHYLYSMDHAALPDIGDTVLCLIHSLTTLKLAKSLLRGNETTRAAYQAPAIIRPVLAVVAVARKDQKMHGAVVKLLHAFLYTRLLIFASKRIRLTRVQSAATIYAQSVFLGAILAIESSGLPSGVIVYIATVGVVMVLNRYVSKSLSRSPEAVKSFSVFHRLLMRSFLWIGLAELNSIKPLQHLPLSSSLKDEYTNECAVVEERTGFQILKSSKQN